MEKMSKMACIQIMICELSEFFNLLHTTVCFTYRHIYRILLAELPLVAVLLIEFKNKHQVGISVYASSSLYVPTKTGHLYGAISGSPESLDYTQNWPDPS